MSPYCRVVRPIILCAGLGWVALPMATSAFAQTADVADKAPEAPAKAAKDANTTVTVKGKKKYNRIDRQVYAVDPEKDGATALEALSKVPGVVVNPVNDDIRYRGKPVQIYLNGHPSLMLKGDNRGDALRSMPSGIISSFEIISNPGAQFSSSDSGPILNINTKANLPPGGQGSVNVQAGTQNNNVGLFGSYHIGKWSTMASLGGSSFNTVSKNASQLQALATGGQMASTTLNDGRTTSRSTSPNAFLSVEYDLNHDNVLTGQLMISGGHNHFSSHSRTQVQADSGVITDDHSAFFDGDSDNSHQGLELNWLHYGRRPDETLKIDGRLSRATWSQTGRSDTDYLIQPLSRSEPETIDRTHNRSDTHRGSVSLDYARPVGDDQLGLGLDINQESGRSSSQSYGPDAPGATPTLNTLLSYDFQYDQTISAAYMTWQRELGERLTVLGGLRAERFDLRTQSSAVGLIHDTRLNPSLFATYLLSHDAKLRFSFTHRLQRPTPQNLDPSLRNFSTNSVQSGNPSLKPQETDAFELNYEYDHARLSASVRGFYQNDRLVITAASHIIPDPRNLGNTVIESTYDNSGHGRTGGVQLTFSNSLGKKLFGNVSLTLSDVHLQSVVAAAPQSSLSSSGNMFLMYTLSPKDNLSVTATWLGRQVTGEGHTGGFAFASLNYGRRLNSKLYMNISVNSPIGGKRVNLIDNALLRSRNWSSPQPVSLMIRLSRSFGGPKVAKK